MKIEQTIELIPQLPDEDVAAIGWAFIGEMARRGRGLAEAMKTQNYGENWEVEETIAQLEDLHV